MKKYRYRNKDWLINQYVVLNQSIGQVARLGRCSKTTIKNWLEKFNIEKLTCEMRECGRVVHEIYELTNISGKRMKVCNVCRDSIKLNIKKRDWNKSGAYRRQYFD